MPEGEAQVSGTAQKLVGTGKLIDPVKIGKVFVSPRKRAVKTFELLFGAEGKADLEGSGRVEVTEDIGEWGYGDYEGRLTEEIRTVRKERGLDTERPWNIWKDGCEDGE